jgi:hypothetical protein
MKPSLTSTVSVNKTSKLKKKLWDEFQEIAQEILMDKNEDILNSYVAEEISNIFNTEEDDNWLGSYQSMKSPGVISFNKKLILSLAKNIFIGNIRNPPYERNLTINDAKRILYMVFDMVLNHELFHYFCDVLIPFKHIRVLKFIPEEESLAVAFSYLRSYGTGNYYNSFNKYKFRESFFDKLKSPGYKDWIKYENKTDFVLGAIKYIHQDSYSDSIVNYCENFLKHGDSEEKKSIILRFELLITPVISKPNVIFNLV